MTTLKVKGIDAWFGSAKVRVRVEGRNLGQGLVLGFTGLGFRSDREAQGIEAPSGSYWVGLGVEVRVRVRVRFRALVGVRRRVLGSDLLQQILTSDREAEGVGPSEKDVPEVGSCSISSGLQFEMSGEG